MELATLLPSVESQLSLQLSKGEFVRNNQILIHALTLKCRNRKSTSQFVPVGIDSVFEIRYPVKGRSEYEFKWTFLRSIEDLLIGKQGKWPGMFILVPPCLDTCPELEFIRQMLYQMQAKLEVFLYRRIRTGQIVSFYMSHRYIKGVFPSFFPTQCHIQFPSGAERSLQIGPEWMSVGMHIE